MVKPIKKLVFYSTLCCRNTRYQKLIQKSQSSITKELDLRKFIYRQRLQSVAILGILSGRQSLFVDKMSQLVIRESSNFEETSGDEELSDWQRDDMVYAKRMKQSSNRIDQRLINIYKIRRAQQLDIHLGFDKKVESVISCSPRRPKYSQLMIDDSLLVPRSRDRAAANGLTSKSEPLKEFTATENLRPISAMDELNESQEGQDDDALSSGPSVELSPVGPKQEEIGRSHYGP